MIVLSPREISVQRLGWRGHQREGGVYLLCLDFYDTLRGACADAGRDGRTLRLSTLYVDIYILYSWK